MTELYINTEGMRGMARSIKDGQGTPAGSMAKMLIDCCDKIDHLTAANKKMKGAPGVLQQITDKLESITGEQNVWKAIDHLTAKNAELKKFILDNNILDISEDLNYRMAILDGSWPQSVEILTRALENAKALKGEL